MQMIKASKIWNKLSLSPSVILVKRPVCLCLNALSITCMHIHVDKYILNIHKVVIHEFKDAYPYLYQTTATCY